MKAVRVERKATRANALRVLGVNPNLQRVLVSESLSPDAALLALPFWDGEGPEPVQKLQDSGGNVGFMVGISAVGGADQVLAP